MKCPKCDTFIELYEGPAKPGRREVVCPVCNYGGLAKSFGVDNKWKRYGRGWVLAATSHIRKVSPSTTKAQLWKVESERLQGTYYSVVLKSDGTITCDCPDYEHRQPELCKHIYAVIIWETT